MDVQWTYGHVDGRLNKILCRCPFMKLGTENVPILRKYTLNCLGAKGYDTHTSPFNCSGRTVKREGVIK